MNKQPEKLKVFMSAVMKVSKVNSLNDLLMSWGIDESEYEEIVDWFKNEYDISL